MSDSGIGVLIVMSEVSFAHARRAFLLRDPSSEFRIWIVSTYALRMRGLRCDYERSRIATVRYPVLG